MADHVTALVWFRRDLRLRDNPALSYALAHANTVVPVYVFAPEEDGEWQPGAASQWWLHHSLSALDSTLRERGARLILRRGPTRAALAELIHESGATLLTFNRLYEPALRRRDQEVEQSFASSVDVETFNGNLLFEPGTVRNGEARPYKVFTAFWRKTEPQLDTLRIPARAPRKVAMPTTSLSSLSTADFELLPRVRWDGGLGERWQPGEAGAAQALKDFDKTANGYDASRNRPDLVGTSRFSPYLHFGELTPHQILARLRDERFVGVGPETFRRELGWREFAHHLLHDFPETATQPLDARFTRMPWSKRQTTQRKWQRGMTGYPIVDAGMRELWRTGWMHNRVRMIVASFFTKNLQHHWLDGARWFWETLVDADLANNTLGWQWTAGCGADAAPYYRVFNPTLQAERFDPQRAYVRLWIPELAQLPDRWIHRPWFAPPAVLKAAGVILGKHYPQPIVELNRSRDEALRAYQRIQVRAS